MRHLLALPLLALTLAVPASAHAYEARHVFITNRGGGNIVELDASFSYQRTWFEGMPFEGAELSAPNGMAFTPDGALFVADTQNQRIVAFDASGTFVRAFSTTARLSVAVESIYFDGAGVMFATANPGNGVVARFDRTGMNLADVVNAPAFLNLGNVNLTEVGNVLVSGLQRDESRPARARPCNRKCRAYLWLGARPTRRRDGRWRRPRFCLALRGQ